MDDRECVDRLYEDTMCVCFFNHPLPSLLVLAPAVTAPHRSQLTRRSNDLGFLNVIGYELAGVASISTTARATPMPSTDQTTIAD
jgi:hypothetical protein